MRVSVGREVRFVEELAEHFEIWDGLHDGWFVAEHIDHVIF